MKEFLKSISGVLCENGKLSIGRLLLWIFTGVIIYFYYLICNNMSDMKDIPESLINIFNALLIYNLFKKGRDVVQNWISEKPKKLES